MSKVEHDFWRESACLCGKGQVTKHVASTDYVFGSAEVTYSLDCDECSKDWRFEHKTFTLRSSELDSKNLYQRWSVACDVLGNTGQRLVDAHFSKLGSMSKKAEMAELSRLGLGVGSYRNYLESRRSQSPGHVAGFYGDCAGLIQIAGAEASAVQEMIRSRDQLRRDWNAAGRRVIRRPLPPS